MSSSNLAIVFTPCLLFPSDGSTLSERDLELGIAVLRAFIERPRMFGTLHSHGLNVVPLKTTGRIMMRVSPAPPQVWFQRR